MAKVDIIDDKAIKIKLSLEDAILMVREAASKVDYYASEIITTYEKMPDFQYIFYCFYAYEDSAKLFENILETDPKNYNTFSFEAPDAFYYTLYGGMAGLYDEAKKIESLIM